MHIFCKFFLPLLLFSLILCGCSDISAPADDVISKSDIILDTVITVTLYDGSDESLIDSCFELCREYENLFSRTLSGSEIYKLNNRSDMSISPETAELIKAGLHYSRLSGGAFDIAAGSVTSLWDFKAETPSAPDSAALAVGTEYADYSYVSLTGSTIEFKNDKTMLDLGAIAKGYIADRLKDHLEENGVTSAIINLGGNVLCIGSKPDGSPFSIGVQYPYEDRMQLIAKADISDISIVTSGVYERCFTENGKIYHHILNPDTGMPYDNGLLSVTIISEESVDGDALSTACFALGLDGGMKLIDSVDEAYAIFVTDDFELHYSNGLKDAYAVTEIEQ